MESVGANYEVPVGNDGAPRPADLERALVGVNPDNHVCEMQLADGTRRGFGVEGQVLELVVEIHAVAEIPRLCVRQYHFPRTASTPRPTVNANIQSREGRGGYIYRAIRLWNRRIIDRMQHRAIRAQNLHLHTLSQRKPPLPEQDTQIPTYWHGTPPSRSSE